MEVEARFLTDRLGFLHGDKFSLRFLCWARMFAIDAACFWGSPCLRSRRDFRSGHLEPQVGRYAGYQHTVLLLLIYRPAHGSAYSPLGPCHELAPYPRPIAPVEALYR